MSEVLIDEKKLATLSAAAKHDAEIIDMERAVTRLKAQWEQAKDSSLAAKKSYDKAVNELREMIAAGPSPQMGLFDAGTTAKPALKIADEDQSNEYLDGDSEEDPLLQSIDGLDIPQGQKDKLREIGVFNLGQANELRIGNVKGYEKGAASIPGWGAGKVRKFEEALLALLPDQGETDELSDEVDTVEAAAISSAPEDEPESQDNVRRIRLVNDIVGMQGIGLVAGAEFDAEVIDDVITLNVDDVPYILEPGEFEFVGLVESA